MDAFTARFARELRALTLNSRPVITSLTMLAADGAGVAGAGVVDAVGRHLRTGERRLERERWRAGGGGECKAQGARAKEGGA